jgi:hypothetical protein
MKTHRICIEIIIIGSAVACALALLLATLGAAVGATTLRPPQAQFISVGTGFDRPLRQFCPARATDPSFISLAARNRC